MNFEVSVLHSICDYVIFLETCKLLLFLKIIFKIIPNYFWYLLALSVFFSYTLFSISCRFSKLIFSSLLLFGQHISCDCFLLYYLGCHNIYFGGFCWYDLTWSNSWSFNGFVHVFDFLSLTILGYSCWVFNIIILSSPSVCFLYVMKLLSLISGFLSTSLKCVWLFV